MNFLKKACVLILVMALLSGCAAFRPEPEKKTYTATFLTLFDTVTAIKGRASSEEAFQQEVQKIYDTLERYHQLFDVYHTYEGIANLKTINDNAGAGPVEVDGDIITLLLDCVQYYHLTDGRVNAAMGSVLALWHDARSAGIHDPMNAFLPDESALQEAAQHCRIEDLVIDEIECTVFLKDPAMRLDVGAIAKGWAAQRVAEAAPEGMLISVGGNVCATGPKDDAQTPWVIGIEDPDGGEYLHTIYVSGGSVVTSGDYQRTYTVDGKPYHHIIDPDTLYPADLWRSVSVVCQDSALADALSTAVFLLPLEEGQALLEKCGAEALWLDKAGNKYYSPGFAQLIRT